MTIFEGYLQLIAWFSEKDYFIYPDDTKALILISENDSDSLAVKKSLNKMIEDGILSSENLEKGKILYILNKKLTQFDQDLKIAGNLSIEISKRINWFCLDVVKDDADCCDPLNIKQKDIENLLHIIDFLKKTLDSNLKEE